MSDTRLQAAVPEGEALRYVDDLRTGGRVGLTDERLLLVRDGSTSVAFDDVEAVEYEAFDWFVGLLSLLLVGIGLFGLGRSPAAGVFFALAGLASLAYTYRKRGTATVRVHARAKPVELRPVEGEAFMDAFRTALEAYRERHGLDPADV